MKRPEGSTPGAPKESARIAKWLNKDRPSITEIVFIVESQPGDPRVTLRCSDPFMHQVVPDLCPLFFMSYSIRASVQGALDEDDIQRLLHWLRIDALTIHNTLARGGWERRESLKMAQAWCQAYSVLQLEDTPKSRVGIQSIAFFLARNIKDSAPYLDSGWEHTASTVIPLRVPPQLIARQ